jgi:hypothetical protein
MTCENTREKDEKFDFNAFIIKGPYRTNTSVQRGSAWLGDGDPMTPGGFSLIIMAGY